MMELDFRGAPHSDLAAWCPQAGQRRLPLTARKPG